MIQVNPYMAFGLILLTIFFGILLLRVATRKNDGSRNLIDYLLIWPLLIDQYKAKASRSSNIFVVIGFVAMLALITYGITMSPTRRKTTSVSQPGALDSNSSGIPYSISSEEKSALKIKSERGDCYASNRLAMYYLYGALDLDSATKYFRTAAAKCPEVLPKEYLAGILMHYLDDPKSETEINRLIGEIGLVNAERARALELQLTEMKKSTSH